MILAYINLFAWLALVNRTSAGNVVAATLPITAGCVNAKASLTLRGLCGAVSTAMLIALCTKEPATAVLAERVTVTSRQHAVDWTRALRCTVATDISAPAAVTAVQYTEYAVAGVSVAMVMLDSEAAGTKTTLLRDRIEDSSRLVLGGAVNAAQYTNAASRPKTRTVSDIDVRVEVSVVIVALVMWTSGTVGAAVGAAVGTAVGTTVRTVDGATVGTPGGAAVGKTVGTAVVAAVDTAVGATVGSTVGTAGVAAVGTVVGTTVDTTVGVTVGSAAGARAGTAVGLGLGWLLGCTEDGMVAFTSAGLLDGVSVGAQVGCSDGAPSGCPLECALG
jgi:hypothetical protein